MSASDTLSPKTYLYLLSPCLWSSVQSALDVKVDPAIMSMPSGKLLFAVLTTMFHVLQPPNAKRYAAQASNGAEAQRPHTDGRKISTDVFFRSYIEQTHNVYPPDTWCILLVVR